ncbi:MAG: hypothetical protein GY925_28290 [Actinomycetia bacterium]|nr:hypothetical protein [Actinomycetes bacterium]
MAQRDSNDWIREGMAMWRGLVPNIAEPMAAGMIQMADVFGIAPANVFNELVRSARSELSGRPIEVDVGTTRVALVLDDIVAQTHSLGPAVGQFGDVELTAHSARYHDVDIERATIRLRNVHLRPGTPMELVAAPIELTAHLSQDSVNDLLTRRELGVVLEIVDGVPRIRSLSRPAMGYLEVDLVPAIDHLTIAATAAANDRWRLEKVARRLPSVRFDLPSELHGVITKVETTDDQLVLSGHFPQLREKVSREQIDQVMRRVQNFTGDLLRLPRI